MNGYDQSASKSTYARTSEGDWCENHDNSREECVVKLRVIIGEALDNIEKASESFALDGEF